MTFVGKDEGFGRYTVPAKGCEELQALINRDAEVLLVRDHEGGRPYLVGRQVR